MFLVAAGLGLGGMYLEEGWLTGCAILLLLGGVLLRFSPKRASDDELREDDSREDGTAGGPDGGRPRRDP